MGDWRAVQIEGTCGAEDVVALRKHLAVGFEDERWGPLHNGGISGLPNWADAEIDACGNLGERGYTEECVRDELLKMSAIAPSLDVKVHCGGEDEDVECVATVTLSSGQADVGEPEVDSVATASPEQMRANMMSQLFGGR